MVDVARYLVSETKGFLVTHYGSSFENFLGGFPPEPFPFELHYFLIWTFLPQLWQVTSNLEDDPPPEPLPFPLWRSLKSTLLQILVDQLLNGHSVFLWMWRLVSRLFFAGRCLPPIWIHNIAVFLCSLLYKGLIGYELLLWYDIHVTHTEFIDKLHNLLVLINIPKT